MRRKSAKDLKVENLINDLRSTIYGLVHLHLKVANICHFLKNLHLKVANICHFLKIVCETV